MGLDMYLTKHNYVQHWEHHAPEKHYRVIVKQNGHIVEHIRPERVAYVIEQIGYWRKANHIHKWFVDNCQDGVDDCREAYVPEDALKSLLDVVRRVKDNHDLAETLLPTQSGFFFGGEDYDDWYFNSLDETEKILKTAIDEHDNAEIYYHSSW